MGFPPIGIMSLSSVLKQAGHECVMFDQANPDTPNEVIIEEINRQQPALIGLSFLSTTSYPYAKILARQIRAAELEGQTGLRRRLCKFERRAWSNCSVLKWISSARETASSCSSICSNGSMTQPMSLG